MAKHTDDFDWRVELQRLVDQIIEPALVDAPLDLDHVRLMRSVTWWRLFVSGAPGPRAHTLGELLAAVRRSARRRRARIAPAAR